MSQANSIYTTQLFVCQNSSTRIIRINKSGDEAAVLDEPPSEERLRQLIIGRTNRFLLRCERIFRDCRSSRHRNQSKWSSIKKHKSTTMKNQTMACPLIVYH